MPAMQESHLRLEVAHVLFIDVVGYSKLLVNEQREVMQQINSSARRQFAAEQLKSIRTELRKMTGEQ
jgi:hypothetical protein